MSDVYRPLPNSWIEVELNELTTVNYGKALSAKIRSTQGCVPVVGSSGTVGHHNKALVDGPCLVVGRKGAAGSVHLVRESSWPIDTAYFIQPPQDIDLVYLTFLLGTCELGSLDKSTAIPSLSRDDLYRVNVPIAPRAEQTRIVAKLEELLSDLDAGVAELKAAQRKLKQYRQSLLKAAVEGALTADWRAKNKPTETGAQLLERILIERRARWEAKQLAKFAEQGKTLPKDWQKKYPEPVQPDTMGLPELPEGWVWASWSQIGFSQNGRPFPSAAYQDSGVKLLRPGNLLLDGTVGWPPKNTRFLPESYAESNQDLIVGPKELVINLTAQSLKDDFLGRVCITGANERCLLNQRIARLTSIVVLTEFAHFVFMSPLFRQFVANLNTGSLIQHMFTSQVEAFALPVPPLAEQERVAELLDMGLQSIEDQNLAIEESLKQSTAQRQNILRAAFAGQLVPQDPNDEPASVLLERIRAERAAKPVTKKVRSKIPKE